MPTRPQSAKLTLTEQPVRGERAWRCKFTDSEHFIPKSCINAYDPHTRTISIETWILKQKSIPFKLK